MQTVSKQILDRGSEFLKSPDVLSRLDSQIQADIQAGKKEFFLAEYYMRKKLPGAAGNVPVIRPEDVRAQNITNLDGGKLPLGRVFALVAVGIAYGYSATDVTAEKVRYSNSEYLNTIPTCVVNSDVEFTQDGKTLIECRTKKMVTNAFAEYGSEANEENGLVLPQPKLVKGGALLGTELKFGANAAALPANYHYVEVRFVGVEIRDRVNQ